MVGPGGLQAQPSEPYSLSVQDRPLATVLAEVKSMTGISLMYESSLADGKQASCVVQDVALDVLLDCVLTGTGLRAERLGSGTYAIRMGTDRMRTEELHETTMIGFVRSAETGEALSGATVYATHLGRGTTTNEYGYFSLQARGDSIHVAVRFLGYTTVRTQIHAGASRPVQIALDPKEIELDAIEVTADRTERGPMSSPGVRTVPVQQLESMPALLGEPDVLRSLQTMPGVQTGADGSAGLFVRGGTRGQNLILLDGAPVYNAYHVFGFLSVFSPQSVRDVELRTGAFPARYGGRLSSVLSLRLKEGNRREYAGQASLGLLTVQGSGEGPLVGDSGSFMVTGRRSVAGDIAHRVAPDDVPFARFYDLSAKANVDLSDRDQLYVSLYRSSDQLENEDLQVGDGPMDAESADQGMSSESRRENTFGLGWENTLATVRWNRAFGSRAFSRAMVLVSDYRYRTRENQQFTLDNQIVDAQSAATSSGLTDVGARMDVDVQASARSRLRLGGTATLHRYRPGERDFTAVADRRTVIDTSIAPAGTVSAMEWAGYAENDVDVTDRVSLNAGMRVSGYSVQGRTRVHVEPRLAASVQLTQRLRWDASYARMAQYIHQLSNSGVGLPTDLWVPSTRSVGAQSSHQATTALTARLGNGATARVEAYGKWMNGLLEYLPGASYVSGRDWQTLVTEGRGQSRGVEFSVQKPAGRLTGNVSYTLSNSTRTFPELNGGNSFPFRYDHRHNVALTASYAFSEKVRATASWMYRTGSAITLPTLLSRTEQPIYLQRGTSLGQTVQEYSERNGFRMPAYHRLDLSLQRVFPTSWGEHQIQAGVFNAYNRKNPFFVFLKTVGESRGEGPNIRSEYSRVGRIVTLFPIVPSLRYTVSF